MSAPRVVPTAALPAPPAVTATRHDILPPGERERRRDRLDRRLADRRAQNHGSPYGVERRSGDDDRLGDRRGASGRAALPRAAGIGLMRDYFAQADQQISADETAVPADLLVRFHD